MIQKEKQLLLRDLCARLPYVIVHTWYNKPLDIKCTGIDLYTNTVNLDIPDDDNAKVYIDNCKSYLRPISSMTDEERDELERICSLYACDNDCNEEYGIVILSDHNIYSENPFEALDWLNKKGFDYRGLIPMGLALEAPKDMYNI